MSALIEFFTQIILPYTISIGAVLLLFGGTVLIHELGHFMTAKWFGLRIDAFSIGMGPAIWQKKVNGVVYKIAWLPIGGYVALPQMDITGSAFENEDAKGGKLTEVAPWKRIVIAIAGPFMNVVAALVIAIIIWGAGKQPDPGFQDPVVGEIYQDSEAYAAGLRDGDRIYKVNEDNAEFWADIQIAAMLNAQLDLQIIRDSKTLHLRDVPTTTFAVGKRNVRVLDGIEPKMPPVVGVAIRNFSEGSPAFEAGMEQGDQITAINGENVTGLSSLIHLVNKDKTQPLAITYSRDGKKNTVEVTPQQDEKSDRQLIGIIMKPIYEPEHPPPLRQLNYFKGQIFRTLVAFTRTKNAEVRPGVWEDR